MGITAIQPPLLCVVAPCFNEEDVLPLFYRALKDVLGHLPGIDHEILFVDDGSADATLDRLNEIAREDPRVTVASLSRNFGHQIALTAGLDAARADAVIMMDSDLQHPPALIPSMVKLWREGFDVVSAVRRATADASRFKQLSSGFFYWLINRLSDTPIVPGAADFCLLSRKAHAALQRMPERHRFVRGLVSWIGFRRAFLTFDAPPRAAGRSKYPLWRMAALALDAIVSFSAAPMHLVTRLGLAVVGLGMVYLLYVLGRFLVLDDLVQGWGSLISVVLILGGVQLGAVGLVGEYLARVFEQVKGRPLYLLKQEPARAARCPAAETNRSPTGGELP